MRKSLLTTVVAALFGAVALATPAQATHAWGNYHWARASNPFTVVLGNNVAGVWPSYLTTASGQWDQSTVLNTTVVAGGTTGRKCRATSGRVEVCSSAYGRNGWLGLASIWANGDHITQGTVKVNDTYFSLAQYNNSDERAHVMCQEIGHTFGLGHTSEDGSTQNTCMDYSTSPTSTGPNQHDYDELVTIYGSHFEAPAAAAQTATPGNSSAVGDDPASWGREVSRSTDARHSTFVRDLGNGQTVTTEVTWAR